MDEAARSVIRDFMNGKIRYFTAPPNGIGSEDEVEGSDVEMQ